MCTGIQARGRSWRLSGKSARQACSPPPLGQNSSDVRQLFRSIDRKSLARIKAGDRINVLARLQQQPRAVGQVVLASSVGCIELFEAGKQMLGRKNIGAHIHLADGSLSFRGILLFCDLQKSTIFVANNTAEASGVISDGCPEQTGGIGLGEGIKQPVTLSGRSSGESPQTIAMGRLDVVLSGQAALMSPAAAATASPVPRCSL